MDFYTSICTYYDNIFPFSPPQRDFVELTLKDIPDARILDIGCGTGNLAISLAVKGYRVVAIDYERAMIEAAEKKKNHGLDNLRFKYMDMLKVAHEYEAGSFDGVVCFGNTLVHLLNISDIKKFISAVSSVLREGGIMMLQILNYDYILDEGVDKLPPIENEVISFTRSYGFREDGLINFNTELMIHETGNTVTNSITLMPVRKNTLSEIITAAGFTRIEYFGDFKMNPLAATSMPLVVKALKK